MYMINTIYLRPKKKSQCKLLFSRYVKEIPGLAAIATSRVFPVELYRKGPRSCNWDWQENASDHFDLQRTD